MDYDDVFNMAKVIMTQFINEQEEQEQEEQKRPQDFYRFHSKTDFNRIEQECENDNNTGFIVSGRHNIVVGIKRALSVSAKYNAYQNQLIEEDDDGTFVGRKTRSNPTLYKMFVDNISRIELWRHELKNLKKMRKSTTKNTKTVLTF